MESIREATARGGGSTGRRGKCGIDGGAIAVPVFGAVQAGLVSTVLWAIRHRRRGIAGLAGLVCVALAGSAAIYLYSTVRGKFAVWAELLDELRLRGGEHVLDVGCGRGAPPPSTTRWW